MHTTDYDVGLFETISGLIREQVNATQKNRRGSERHAFDCVQLLAPYDGTHLPELGDFRPVLCRDISRSGFSYLTFDKPRFSHVIAALGRIPPKFFIAEILHVDPTTSKEGHEYQIGCRFLQRLDDTR